jgi:hypothetical protein
MSENAVDKRAKAAEEHQAKLAEETNQAALDAREEDAAYQDEVQKQAAADEKALRDYQLAASGTVSSPVAQADSVEAETAADEEKPKTAHEVVQDIEASEDADEVRSLSEGDDRKTVQDAAEKRLDDLEEDSADDE